MTDRLLATSPDGQWAALREGREVLLLAGGAPPAVGRIELDTDDFELALVGPPSVLVTVARTGATSRVVVHEPPYLDAAARLELDTPVKLAATTGPRLAVVSPDGKQVTVVREAGRALARSSLELGGPIEFAVGLEKNQLLFGVLRRLEVWDAVSGRPLLRPQLPLPPAPRVLGAAAGHLWAFQPGRDEVFVYRLSDGRPFRHHAGAPIEAVICHPASPVLVLVTPRGLVRLHCLAHSLALVDGAPWQPGTPLAQLVTGDEIALLGVPAGSREPWRVPLGVTGAMPAQVPAASDDPAPTAVSAADKLRAMRGAASEPAPPEPAPAPAVRAPATTAATWRDAVAAWGAELARGGDGEPPVVAAGTELGELAHRLALGPAARRALIALYAAYLAGERLPVAQLARAAGEWTEALGKGELGALAMLRRRHGMVGLRTAAADALDGAPPRAIRLVGSGAARPRAGAFRVARDGRSDAEIEAALAAELGRIAVACGPVRAALLEARLAGVPLVAWTAPPERPHPWPRDASLVLVLYGSASSWVADLPALREGAEGPRGRGAEG